MSGAGTVMGTEETGVPSGGRGVGRAGRGRMQREKDAVRDSSMQV